METAEVRRALLELDPDYLDVNSADGRHFEVTVVSARFAGQSRLARQRLVYARLAEPLASGELHALALKTWSPEEWAVYDG